MPSLDPSLRKLLENKIPAVRQIAEEAARAILNTLAINRPEPFASMSPEQRKLRNALRAKARQLGEGSQTNGFDPLVEELAYQQWHRMVFARFLAENQLLMHPSGVAVTLQECGELVQEEGEADAWAVAAKYATLMLPGIFRPNDPESQVRLTPEGQQKLEAALNGIEQPVFLADDALGWMYQFWQKLKKDEINKSERKIGGADLSPVTQLFTEDYMVAFLLENSLGAWWAARRPDSPLIKEWQYLRFKEDGSPAAGSFPGWPETVAQVTLMDPCFGSGHILVAGFHMLSAMRMEEEGLSAAEAGDAVLRDNLFGLELDPRCTQIGAFALALAAWKSGGYHPLPVPNIACSGIPVQGQLDTWLKLAGDDSRVRAGLERLYNLFKNAPDLGSLINPADLPAVDRMFVADYEQVAPALELALLKEYNDSDPTSGVFRDAALNVNYAARLLVGKYTLVITNVPYLKRGKQEEILRDFCKENFSKGMADLSTVFLIRCRSFSCSGGTYSTISPQNWRFLGSYKEFRREILKTQEINQIVPLGPNAFETISGEVVNVVLSVITNKVPLHDNFVSCVDVSKVNKASNKSKLLETEKIKYFNQQSQYLNPNHVISTESQSSIKMLSAYVHSFAGINFGDAVRFQRNFWELSVVKDGWVFQQGSVNVPVIYGGREHICLWENGQGIFRDYALSLNGRLGGSWHRGTEAWNKLGIAVGRMSKLSATIYSGEIFDQSVAVLLPYNSDHIPAIWEYCKSDEFNINVRTINPNLAVSTEVLTQIPFDLDYWQKIADETGPLPAPYSNDPLQWLFYGQPKDSNDPFHVALARLLGYKWPQQKKDNLDALADEDGIICLVPTAGERPLAERLREVLAVAYGAEWSPKLQAELLSSAGAAGKSLEDWLHDDFFASHCRLFQNRPFLWHIWDGRKDGFSAVVNYHKLDAARLDKLIYTYLGDWIRFQRARRDHGEPGADGRLVAALELERKLKLIKEGEPPYDIYVRWKPLAQQPIGWDPDLNDGVRLNIRPFVTAGVLRSKFTVNWNKDRGMNPDGSERLNDLHFTVAEKKAARGLA